MKPFQKWVLKFKRNKTTVTTTLKKSCQRVSDLLNIFAVPLKSNEVGKKKIPAKNAGIPLKK